MLKENTLVSYERKACRDLDPALILGLNVGVPPAQLCCIVYIIL